MFRECHAILLSCTQFLNFLYVFTNFVARLPVALDVEAEDLLAEVNQALATSMMSMTNNGTSTQIQVGISSQTEKKVVENVTAVYKNLQKHFPGKFANVRSLSLRFGNNPWTVPIYISYGKINIS